jgi:hypothetical protein
MIYFFSAFPLAKWINTDIFLWKWPIWKLHRANEITIKVRDASCLDSSGLIAAGGIHSYGAA